MSEVDEKHRGLTVLSIGAFLARLEAFKLRGPHVLGIDADGGGVRGLSSLIILKECMTRLQHELGLDNMPEVYQYFDFIGGTGTGGISATMLGRLRMPLDRAIELFTKLSKDVFSNKKYFSASGSGMFKSTKMQQALKQMIREATGNENTCMLDRQADAARCRTVVFAMSKHNMNAGLPTAFRSYQAPNNQMPDCSIWEALCATTAHPDLFKSIDIGDGAVKESFIDGGLGCSNPLAHILAEVKLMYPNRHIGCVVSIGAGNPRTIHIPRSGPLQRLLATPATEALKGMVTDTERVAQEMAVRFSVRPNVYFRFSVDQGIQDIRLCEWDRMGQVLAHTRKYIDHSEVSSAISKSAIAIRNRRAMVSVEHIGGAIPTNKGQQTTSPGVKSFPRPTSLFVGREIPIKQAESFLLDNANNHNMLVIHGLGGSGKTQVALQVAEKTREHWSDIVYADATSVETIEAALKAFAILKGIGDTYPCALQWLASSQGRWLLVLDNADDPTFDILKYIPPGLRGRVLITTRNQNLLQLAQGPGSDCNLSSMEPEEALQLLVKASRMENEGMAHDQLCAAKALLVDLGHLPLAIVQVGAYIQRNQCSFARYHELYLERPTKMMQQHNEMRMQLDKYERTAFDTWSLSYDLLSTLARRLLWAMAFMQRDRITLDIFRRATLNVNGFQPVIPLSDLDQEIYTYVKEFLSSFLDSSHSWDCDTFLGAVGEILSYSLIGYDRVHETYVLHPLVQSWARTVAPQGLASIHTAFILASSLNWDEKSDDYSFHRALELHMASTLQDYDTLCPDLAACFVNVLYANGKWNRASKLQKKVVGARAQRLGPENPHTLHARGFLACIYSSQGHLQQAEELQVHVLNASKRTIGEDHPSTLTAISNLANTYYIQGHLKQAEELQVQVIDRRKQILGERHPDTLNAVAQLASTYNSQGRLVQAGELQSQVFNSTKQLLGVEHPDTLNTMNNLANTYLMQGRLKEAEELQVQALDASKRVLGNEHPNTLTAMNNLANTYSHQGILKQAEALQLQVLDSRKRVLGEEHPNTLRVMNNLANTYYIQGRLKQAEELQLQVLHASKPVLGEEHPSTLMALNNLANIYNTQGRLKQAEEMQIQVLDARKRVLGEEHPDTLITAGNLANTYCNRGHTKQAEELQLQVLDASKQVLGEEHPNTLNALTDLANTYFIRGHLKRAEELQVHVLGVSKRMLGEEHPDTLTAMNNLASTYFNQGRFNIAKELRVRVLDARNRVLGEEHLNTLSAMSNLASSHYIQGRLNQAEGLQVKVLDARKKVLGEEHPNTLVAMGNLANTYHKQGRLKQTKELEEFVLKARKRTLGPYHPDTLWAMHNLAITYRALGRRYRPEYEALEIGIKQAKAHAHSGSI